jgi:hypothetical protein
MPEVRVACTQPSCSGFFEDLVAWPGTVSMRTVPLRVVPACNACGTDLDAPWTAHLGRLAW